MPWWVLQVPERVRKYVQNALERKWTLSDESVISVFIESMVSPGNQMIPTKEIIELIKTKSLTDEQIWKILEHLKKLDKGDIILRIYRAILESAPISIPVWSSIKSPSQKKGNNRTPSLWMPPIREETSMMPMQEIMIVWINNVQSSIEHATSILENANNDRSWWESCMEKMGLQKRTYQGRKHEFDIYEILNIIGFIEKLLGKYPPWESEHIPKRIRYFILFLIKSKLLVWAKDSEKIWEALISAFQNIPQQKKEWFERAIILIDAHKMISRKTIKVPHSRGNGEETHIKNIYYGYTKTPASHILLWLLLASWIIPKNKCKIYKSAMENRILEIRNNTEHTQESQALRKLLQEIQTILKSANT